SKTRPAAQGSQLVEPRQKAACPYAQRVDQLRLHAGVVGVELTRRAEQYLPSRPRLRVEGNRFARVTQRALDVAELDQRMADARCRARGDEQVSLARAQRRARQQLRGGIAGSDDDG